MFCSRSAMPIICARLGRFMLRRYFSMKSPNCFCAPAVAPPAWFMALENSGDVMAWLAKALNPFSISPIMVCHNPTGSLPLSAIGVLLHMRGVSALLFRHTTPLRRDGQRLSVGTSGRSDRQISFCGATNRAIEFQSNVEETTRGNTVPSVAHQPPRTISANGIDICYEIFGEADGEPMMLIMGLGAQMVLWDDAFCERLAACGFRVIRFDNRDIGQSSQLTGGKRLTPFELLKLRFLKIPVAAPYKLRDMAEDTI